jgi:LPPG:FO 2-phospho-L-lactate transferase
VKLDPSLFRDLRVVALAGGVGGARLADGLAQVLPAGNLTVIVNTGDDFEHLGLYISPDLDTVCYTLAGLANPATGWGRSGESWAVMEALETLGGPTWFRLGDRDLATHLERTRRLQEGQPLSEVTRIFCAALGVGPGVLPMSDDRVATHVLTPQGILPFQEYFVRQRCEPPVSGFHFQGIEEARPAPGVLDALLAADVVLICPSNPWVSIDPILKVPGIGEAVGKSTVIAISPIIAGQAVKGPAAKMYRELGVQPSAKAVAMHYGSGASNGLLAGFVMDVKDADQASDLAALGLDVLTTETLMVDASVRRKLAEDVLSFTKKILPATRESR